MEETIAGITTAVVAKLTALGIFKGVFNGPRSEYEGYPSVTVRAVGFVGRQLDSHRIERTIQFDVDVVQEVSENGKNAAESQALGVKCTDAIIEAFDQDFDIGGAVEGTRIIEGTIGGSQNPGVQTIASIKIETIIIVPNFT